jgi:thioredoxin-related protein
MLFSLNEGERAPAIIMRASNGDSFIPSKQCKAKLLIISFFSDNCLPCLKEIPELQKIQNSSYQAAIYLVSDVATDEKRAAVFLEKTGKNSGMKITIPVVYDSYGDLKDAFRVKGYPALFLVNKNGNIVLRFDGYRPENIEKLNNLLKESR